jgi:hypothetical protein
MAYYKQKNVHAVAILSSGTARRNPVPLSLTDLITVMPSVDGQRDVDDLFCLRIAQERGCQYVDNDNYRDWRERLDEAMCVWMDTTKDEVRIRSTL